ncbi:MAG TPA: hypothetical protein VL475_00400, partial [Planctomycetaceae bacterium]|nr:hypothetical protein [Planctomycetaceae bacterium]
IGTFACDAVVADGPRGRLIAKLLGWGVLLMAIGWVISCGTRWSDVTEAELQAESAAPRDPALGDVSRLGANPVIPSGEAFGRWFTSLKAGEWSAVLAEPPFVPPPHSRDREVKDGKEVEVDHSREYRRWNYWMMSQRCGTPSYLTFASGLSLVLLALFYVLADMCGITIGVFRTLGTNALFGYVVHMIVDGTVKKFAPRDMPALPMWISFAVFFFLTWLLIRTMEKNNIYIKL